ncbi:MAG TPA: peptidase S8, partial [Pseudonocardiaceae bacterium]
MAVQFTRRDPGRDSLADDTFQPPLPQRILDRHGARVLNPSTAVIAAGWAPPRPTVYRSASLLVPEDVLRDGELLNVTNRVLAEAGLQIVLPPPLARLGEDLLPYLDYLDQVPRAVTLRVRPGAPPTEVDSWAALQRLRAAASGEQPLLPAAVVERISVEHLLTSTITVGGTPGSWESSGVTVNDSYVRGRAGNRIPVALAARPPVRRVSADVPGRRPVVAVVDTGIAPHPWFGIADRSAPPPAGEFLRVLPGLQ